MKTFNRIFAAVIVVMIAAFIGTNIYLYHIDLDAGRSYRVEAARLEDEIEENGFEGSDSLDLSKYPSIIAVQKLDSADTEAFFEGENSDYLIKEIDREYYRFDYRFVPKDYRRKMVIAFNLMLEIISAAVIALLLYIKIYLLRPFEQLKDIPYELSKGNLTLPLKESKNRFFGRFLWGMDLLRENLEQQKENSLKLQKEKKTLILSLSHDIKTPLSAIKLYAKALSKNIYDTPEKNLEISEHINAKADEIESFLSQIIEASQEDFLNLSVENGEFYMSEVINKISEYYGDKLNLLKIPFTVSKYSDCLLKGDMERTVEILQNVMENAVKYGDGEFIAIDFADEEDCRLITISNSGCTLSENEMPHIFDSFWRGSNTGSNSGSGLGLYICRQLVHKMDGEIFAECKDGVMRVTVLLRKV